MEHQVGQGQRVTIIRNPENILKESSNIQKFIQRQDSRTNSILKDIERKCSALLKCAYLAPRYVISK